MYNGQLTTNNTAPVSGRCTTIAIHPTDPNTVYAGTATGGVWKTTDTGNNWKPLMDDQICLSVGVVAFDPKNPDRVYVATGEGNAGGEILPGRGLLVYTAAPTEGWELRAAADLDGKHVRAMVINAATAPYTIWLATDQGLMKSVDDGQHFTAVNIPSADDATKFTDPSKTDLVYNATDNILYVAVFGDGIYQSVGGGAFTRLPKGPGNLPDGKQLARIAIGICKTKPENLYASFADSAGKFVGIFKSTDKGANWSPCNLPKPTDDLGQGWYNHYLTVDPVIPNIVFFGELKVWRSSDGGQNWKRSSDANGDSPGMHSDQHCLAISDSDQTKVWAGNDGGVWYSSDSGVSFFNRNRGLETMQYYSLAQHPDDASILLAGAQDNGSQRYEGHPAWDLATYGDGFFCAIDQVEPFRWYAAYVFLQDGKIKAIQRSEKAGKLNSWDNKVDGLYNTFPKKQEPFYVPFVIDPTDHQVLYLGTNVLFRSDHFADNWQAVNDAFTLTTWMTPTKATISALAVNPWDGTQVYVGTVDGNVFALTRQPSGNFVVKALSGLPGVYVGDIGVAPPVPPATTSNLIYVGLGSPQLSGVPDPDVPAGRIFSRDAVADPAWKALKTADLDRTFSGVTFPHTKNPVNAIAVDPDNPKTVYIGCDSGVFRSVDQGTSWTLYSDNLPNVAISDLQFHRKTKLLRAATIGRSIWEIDASASTPPPNATIFVRRNIIDVGRDPVAASAPDPLSKGDTVTPLSGADIKIDTPHLFFSSFQTPASFEIYGDNASPADYVAFPQLDTLNEFRRSKKSRIYAEVMNRGPADATNVVVRAFYAAKTGAGYPALPADFWTKFPDSDPDVTTWKSFGAKITLGTVKPAQPRVAMWELPELPSDTGDPVGVLVVATSTEDPVKTTELNISNLETADRHVAIREASVNMATAEVVGTILLLIGVAGLVGLAAYSAAKS
jgi:photosystem II stability/assembly factor-like uncharacterized protein